VHPDADGGGSRSGEAAIGAWTAAFLAKLGADVEVRELAPGRPNVIAVFEPRKKARATLAFAPHLDTVGVGQMTVAPFRLSRRNGRLHGRGACDTKGPTAALYSALHHWSRSPQHRATDVRWCVIATAGEEQGSLGAEFLCKRGAKADFALALEPTDLKVVMAAKGVLRVWISAKGRAAHAAKPHRGLNAIYRLLPLLDEIRGPITRRLAKKVHPILGRSTVNLATVRGGGELNVVPSSCSIGLDFRTHPGCKGSEILAMLRTAIALRCPGAKMTVVRDRPSFVLDRAGEWVRRVHGVSDGWATADWFCDANIFNHFGIPSAAFGPGSIMQAHTKNEFISERALAAGAQAFATLLSGGPHR
jgi:acetylornithine deacetylase/succinyl-diaminopimelate desuccinylase-like protein